MKISPLLKVSGLYFIFSTLWVKLSDTILSSLVKDPDLLTKLQTYKGLTFVIISTSLIYFLLLSEVRKRNKEEKEKNKYYSMIQAIIDNSNLWVFIKKLNGEYFLANSKFLSDLNQEEIVGKRTKDIFPATLSEELENTDNKILKNGTSKPFEFDYNEKTFLCSKFPITDENNSLNLIGGIAQDITKFKAFHRDSLLSDEVFDNSKDGIIIFDHKKKIIRANQAFCNITLFDSKDILNVELETLDSFIHSENSVKNISNSLIKNNEWRGELWLRKKNGEIFPCWTIFSKIHVKKNESMYMGMFEDLTELRENKKSIHKLGNYDLLTNLPNQFLMRDRLTQAFLKADINKKNVGFIYFDIDNFKDINKYFDYSSGDELICNVTERVSTSLRSDHTFARISGDEFAIVIPDAENAEKISFIAEQIKQVMKKPFLINSTEYKVSTSMGIAVYPTDGGTTEDIIKNAHTALEHIKNNGKNNYHFYSSNLSSDSKRKLELSNALKYAIDYNELFLVYQPKVNIFTEDIIGVETLIRWQHAKNGIISPFEFIPIAEENGEIASIGTWVINEACSQMRKWRNAGVEIGHIAINLSPIQFKNDKIVEEIIEFLDKYNLEPSDLEIEITEGTLVEDLKKTTTKLNQFRAHGFKLSIDDFGTGYSSLSYLKNFPVDTLKIDRTFVKDFPEKDDGTISKIIVNLAKSLNLSIVAEGVETKEQLKLMKSMNVHIAQGYYFHKPLYPEVIEKLIKKEELKL